LNFVVNRISPVHETAICNPERLAYEQRQRYERRPCLILQYSHNCFLTSDHRFVLSKDSIAKFTSCNSMCYQFSKCTVFNS